MVGCLLRFPSSIYLTPFLYGSALYLYCSHSEQFLFHSKTLSYLMIVCIPVLELLLGITMEFINSIFSNYWSSYVIFVFVFFFFFLMAAPKFLGQGLNMGCTYDLHHSCSCSNVRSFNPLHQAKDWTRTSTAIQAAAVGFLTHCTAAGTPIFVF